jgi:hypothetical protein
MESMDDIVESEVGTVETMLSEIWGRLRMNIERLLDNFETDFITERYIVRPIPIPGRMKMGGSLSWEVCSGSKHQYDSGVFSGRE